VDAFDFSMKMDSLYQVRIEARLIDEEEEEVDSNDEEETNGDVMDEDGKEGTKKKSKRTNASPFVTLTGAWLDQKWMSLQISMQISPRPSSPISTRSFLPYVASSSDVSYLLSIQASTSQLLSSKRRSFQAAV
jgi:hypothetical protein